MKEGIVDVKEFNQLRVSFCHSVKRNGVYMTSVEYSMPCVEADQK